MFHKTQRIFTTLAAVGLALISFGCTSAPVANSNSSANANTNANANVSDNANANTAAGGAASPVSAREPERYSMKMAITGQAEASNRQGNAHRRDFCTAESFGEKL